MLRRIEFLAVSTGMLFSLGCDTEGKPEGGAALAEIARAKPTLTAAASTKESTPKLEVPIEPSVKRPQNLADLELTDERRTRLEKKHPEAAGFLDLSAVEEKLQKMEFKRGKDAPAVAAFDQLARGRWILLKGPVAKPAEDGLTFHVRYTPRDAQDPFGLTATWFPIHVTDIEGFDSSEYEVGTKALILAKYDGGQKASRGVDVVLLEEWFD